MKKGNAGVKIKICGLTRPEDITYVNEALPDYAGFVIGVPDSRRNTTPDQVRELRRLLDPSIGVIGVFCNAPPELVIQLAADGTVDAVQLHGQEDESYIRFLRERAAQENMQHRFGKGGAGIFIIRAFQEKTIALANESSADLILLDHGSGGTGRTFDWKLTGQIHRPFFLAGGIGPENITAALSQVKPWGIDMSSAVETGGRKDRNKILEAVRLCREGNGNTGKGDRA